MAALLFDMSDSNVIGLPSDQRVPQWWLHSPVMVRWVVERELETPFVTGCGSIWVPLGEDEISQREVDEDEGRQKIGRITIAKVPLGKYDAVMAADSISSDHEGLVGDLLTGGYYSEGFYDWVLDEFGLEYMSDLVLLLDLEIDPTYSDPDCKVAAHAALDALLTFGAEESPLVTFYRTAVNPELRDALREEGLWAWVHALRAKRWKDTYVAVPFR